ncbi:MAG: hypothetical protein WCJ46_05345 [bacterium]
MKKVLIAVSFILAFSLPVFAEMSNIVIDETVLEPKDPILATVLALGPGLLAHGWGHFYAEDYRMGLTLFGVEIGSLVGMTIGYFEYANPNGFTSVAGDYEQVKRAGAITIAASVLFFVATWFVDIARAGSAAEQFNLEHGLEFKMNQESMNDKSYILAYTYKF